MPVLSVGVGSHLIPIVAPAGRVGWVRQGRCGHRGETAGYVSVTTPRPQSGPRQRARMLYLAVFAQEPVVGLLGALVATKGGQPGQPPTVIGAAEAADRYREAVQDRHLRVEADPAEQLLTELGLDRPQIGRLVDEGGAVHAPQGREPVAVVATKVLVQALVGVDARGTPRHTRWSRPHCRPGSAGAALAQANARQPVVDQAVHRDEQRRSIHARPPYAW